VAPVEASSAPWLPITLVLGLGFLAGQWMAWSQLARQGVFISSNPSNSFFYLLTGAHAVHLVGGVLALAYAATTAVLSQAWERRRMVVDVTSWYWHFMAALWIYIFALLQFAK
jgi:cytochrome c oxidase subunit 3